MDPQTDQFSLFTLQNWDLKPCDSFRLCQVKTKKFHIFKGFLRV